VHGAAQASTRWGATAVSLGFSRERDRGFSALDATSVPAANPDADGYRNTSLALNLSQDLASGHRLAMGWVRTEGRLDYDSAFASPADVQTSHTVKDMLRVSSENQVNSAWLSMLSLSSQVDDARLAESGAFGYQARYKTRVDALNWVNTVAWRPGTTLTAGLEHQRQRIGVDDGFGGLYDKSRLSTAVFGGVQARLGDHEVSLNLRRDQVGALGGKTSGSLGWGWQLAPAWKVIANVGNAFSVPPLGYLYAPYYGNPDLKPEIARSAELGLQWTVAGQRLRATLFQTQVRQELEYDTTSFMFGNLASTRNRGLELSYTGRVGSADLRGSLTAQDPVDDLTGGSALAAQ